MKQLVKSHRPLGIAMMALAVVALLVAMLLPHHHHDDGGHDSSARLCFDEHQDGDEHSRDDADGVCLHNVSFVLSKQTSPWGGGNTQNVCTLPPTEAPVLCPETFVYGRVCCLAETFYDSAALLGGGLRAPPVC